MSKYFYNPVVGIDVSADFSIVAILAPNGDLHRKPFKFAHDVDGFNHLLREIEKVEKDFNMKTGIFMESTGVYHLSLFHFLQNHNLEEYVINPLVTNCNKNSDIRKVKNGKKDAISIAKIGKFQNIKAYTFLDINIFALKCLCRDYYKYVDTRSIYKKKLSSDLRLFFHGYQSVFSDTTGATSINILKQYTSPEAIINAPKEDVMTILRTISKKNLVWCNNTYEKLLKMAHNAKQIGIPALSFERKILSTISIIENFDKEINLLINDIRIEVSSERLSSYFKKNVDLLLSIPGIGFLTAVTLLTEIGDFQGFLKPKHLVAFFGIDPSVNESGKFKSDKNKISKRSTRIGRRALYAVALASIRTSSNGKAINPILLEYYKTNLSGKKKKVALVAVMHKLINYIFAVLRNQKEYEQRLPKVHQKMYLENANKVAA
ncbi:IS110 family transposase [Clostridium sp. UBA7339]|uniref:IS110 family transposase n=1 Tax=Clostridium sp. UBA7339 TaxID=1946376 RepID=UPI0032165992